MWSILLYICCEIAVFGGKEKKENDVEAKRSFPLSEGNTTKSIFLFLRRKSVFASLLVFT